MLERNSRVELQPTIQQLFDSILQVARNLVAATQAVPRVALQLTERARREIQVGSRLDRGARARGGGGAGAQQGSQQGAQIQVGSRAAAPTWGPPTPTAAWHAT